MWNQGTAAVNNELALATNSQIHQALPTLRVRLTGKDRAVIPAESSTIVAAPGLSPPRPAAGSAPTVQQPHPCNHTAGAPGMQPFSDHPNFVPPNPPYYQSQYGHHNDEWQGLRTQNNYHHERGRSAQPAYWQPQHPFPPPNGNNFQPQHPYQHQPTDQHPPPQVNIPHNNTYYQQHQQTQNNDNQQDRPMGNWNQGGRPRSRMSRVDMSIGTGWEEVTSEYGGSL